MSLDKLLEKTEIKFPRPIDREEMHELFKFLANQLEGYEFNVHYEKEIRYGSRFNQSQKKIPIRIYNKKISGSVSNSNGMTGFECFKKDSIDSGNKFYEIKFFTPPGYDLEEVNPKDIATMDTVREKVKLYFSQNP